MKKTTILTSIFLLFVIFSWGDVHAAGIKTSFGSQDLDGTSGGGSGVPIDGGISTMIVGTALYGYRMMKKRNRK